MGRLRLKVSTRVAAGGSACAPTRLLHDRYGGDVVPQVSTGQRILDEYAFVMKTDRTLVTAGNGYK